MKITDITKQTKREHRVNVFVDEKYSFSLSVSQLADLGISIGDEVDSGSLEKFKKLSKIGKLKELATAWALRRNHSEKEITDYIAKKTEDSSEQKEVLEYLKKLDFVDDKRFAQGWVESRRRRGMSQYVIKGELITKRIDVEIIQDVLESSSSDLDALILLIEKKKKQARYQDKQKFMAYLASKGFRYHDIKKALKG